MGNFFDSVIDYLELIMNQDHFYFPTLLKQLASCRGDIPEFIPKLMNDATDKKELNKLIMRAMDLGLKSVPSDHELLSGCQV